jgi:predicted amidohydrolase
MRVAISQISPKLSRDNFELHFNEIKKAKSEADIIVFPELSMSGYMLMDSVYEDAFELSDLDEFKTLSKDIDIIIGAVTKESHKIYNSALYFSQGELLSIHHKNNLPNYGMFQEARFFFKGEGFELFENSFGKCMMVVCEDLWSSHTIDLVASKKPDFLFVIANSPSRDFSDEGLLGIEKQWTRILSTTAILSGAHVIFSNRVGFEDGLGFWGGSKVINPSGKIEKTAKLFERDQLLCDVDHNLSNIQKYLLRGN